MPDEHDDLETIRRRNYFAERDVPSPECGHNLRDVRGPVCPDCGFERIVNSGRLLGEETVTETSELFAYLVATIIAIATLFLFMAPATFWPSDLNWLVIPRLFVAGGAGTVAFLWSFRRIKMSNRLRWTVANRTSNAGMLIRLFIWAAMIVVAIGFIYRIVRALKSLV